MGQRTEKRKRRAKRLKEMQRNALRDLSLYGETFLERKGERVVSVGRQLGKSLMERAVEEMKEEE